MLSEGEIGKTLSISPTEDARMVAIAFISWMNQTYQIRGMPLVVFIR
jgi:hypothetical protein